MTVDARIKAVAPIATRPLFDLAVDLHPSLDIGAGPLGKRVRFGAAGGTFHGDRLSGEVLPTGGDWALFRPDATMALDVRLTLRTNENELIHLTYSGRWVQPPDVRAALADRTTRLTVDPSRYYFRTAVQFETGAENLLWLNDIIAVGSGYLIDGGVAYHVAEVT